MGGFRRIRYDHVRRLRCDFESLTEQSGIVAIKEYSLVIRGFLCRVFHQLVALFSHEESLLRRSGGDLMTCLSSFSNLRYSGGFRGFGSLAPALSFSFCSAITQPPDRSEDSKSDAFRSLTLELPESVHRRSSCAR